jgi:hypothetical protein
VRLSVEFISIEFNGFVAKQSKIQKSQNYEKPPSIFKNILPGKLITL